MKDFCLNNRKVFVSEEVESLLQQIDMLFDTNPTEVFGEEYGSKFYDFLWDMKASANDISEYTKKIIYKDVVLNGWSLNVITDIIQGTLNDIILIRIQLSKYDETYEKIYRVD
jgi:hypothetical protein